MTFDPFWLKVALSFVFAAIIVVLATVAGERAGTKVGGIIGTMPTTIIPALYFIGLTNSPTFVAEVTVTIPATMGANALFLIIFYKAASWNVRLAPFISLGVWSVVVAPLMLLDFMSIYISIVIFAMLVTFTWYMFEHRTRLSSMKVGKMRYPPLVLASRGLLAGTIISLAVVLAQYTGPYVGGIISVFPAIFFSTMFIYTRAHGVEYAGAMGRVMTLGGSAVTAYAVTAHFAFPAWGLERGTLISFLAGCLVSIALYSILKRTR